MVAAVTEIDGINLNNVTFAYPNCPPFIKDGNLNLPRGSRCLLIGANGTGKTTLLQLVAGETQEACTRNDEGMCFNHPCSQQDEMFTRYPKTFFFGIMLLG
jgi:ABC-type Mn2+/Zn2+ transport system ATPase subunit